MVDASLTNSADSADSALAHPSAAGPMPFVEADRLLKQFDGLSPLQSAQIDRDLVRAALRQVVAQSDYQIFGVCADSLDQASLALQGYTTALGYHPQCNLPPLAGSVYLKYNPRSGLCYADTYRGEHRGVLVSCQSAEPEGLNQMYGHFPLDLWSA